LTLLTFNWRKISEACKTKN